jgi:hypothetical protein
LDVEKAVVRHLWFFVVFCGGSLGFMGLGSGFMGVSLGARASIFAEKVWWNVVICVADVDKLRVFRQGKEASGEEAQYLCSNEHERAPGWPVARVRGRAGAGLARYLRLIDCLRR